MSEPKITYVPVEPPDSIPPMVFMGYLNVLLCSLTIVEGTNNPETIQKTSERLTKICEKHLSDLPSRMDAVRLHVEVFELALKFARGG